MPGTHVDTKCNRVATLHVTNPKSTHQSTFAKYAKLHQLAHLHDPPRYLLAESDRITSPTHINKEALQHIECNRERVDVARCHITAQRVTLFLPKEIF